MAASTKPHLDIIERKRISNNCFEFPFMTIAAGLLFFLTLYMMAFDTVIAYAFLMVIMEEDD